MYHFSYTIANAGKISHEVAEALAIKEYEEYRVIQDKNYVSDFDREVKKLLLATEGTESTEE